VNASLKAPKGGVEIVAAGLKVATECRRSGFGTRALYTFSVRIPARRRRRKIELTSYLPKDEIRQSNNSGSTIRGGIAWFGALEGIAATEPARCK